MMEALKQMKEQIALVVQQTAPKEQESVSSHFSMPSNFVQYKPSTPVPTSKPTPEQSQLKPQPSFELHISRDSFASKKMNPVPGDDYSSVPDPQKPELEDHIEPIKSQAPTRIIKRANTLGSSSQSCGNSFQMKDFKSRFSMESQPQKGKKNSNGDKASTKNK